MRKLGLRIEQKGNIKRKKDFNELISELTKSRSSNEAIRTKKQYIKKETSKKQIAKQLGISRFQLYRLEKSKKPINKILRSKLSKFAQKKKIKLTQTKGVLYPTIAQNLLTEVVNISTFKKLQNQMSSKTFFGGLIRVNIKLFGSNGSTNEWFTFILNKVEHPQNLKSLKELNRFIIGGIKQKLNDKRNLYQVENLSAFEIIETVIDITTNEYTPNARKKSNTKAKTNNKNIKQTGKGKKPRKGKK